MCTTLSMCILHSCVILGPSDEVLIQKVKAEGNVRV